MNDLMPILIVLVPINILTIVLVYLFHSHRKISQLKKSNLNEILTKCLDDFKAQIKVDYLAAGRVKLTFPVKVADKPLHFYLEEHQNLILVSDFGEILSRLDTDKTLNRNAIQKICGTFDIIYNPYSKALQCLVTPDKLDETIWEMYSALLVMEYVRY